MYEEVLVRDMHKLHMIKLESKLTPSEKGSTLYQNNQGMLIQHFAHL